MSLPPTQWTLIDAARGGDQAGFKELVTRYQQPVLSFLRRQGLGAEAEDLAQEVFLQLYQSVLKRADPEQGRFRNLLLAVARNVVRAHRRHHGAAKRGAGRVESLAERDPTSPEGDAGFDREWLANLLSLGLGRLATEHPSYYAALSRHLLQGQPYTEIAAALGCSQGDVGNRIHRGRRRLAAYLRAEVRTYTLSRQEYATELELIASLVGKD